MKREENITKTESITVAERKRPDKKPVAAKILLFILIVLLLSGAFLLTLRPWDRLPDPADLDEIDLTAMRSDMVNKCVTDMHIHRPEAYFGKPVRARGEYYSGWSEPLQKNCHFVVIKGVVTCCPQGLEITYDGDFPEHYKTVEVYGTFEFYEQNGNTFYYIKVTDLSVL